MGILSYFTNPVTFLGTLLRRYIMTVLYTIPSLVTKYQSLFIRYTRIYTLK